MTPSFWILGFSVFAFLSLVLLKRYVELAENDDVRANEARGYLSSDLGLVQGIGITTGQVSALVLSLYVRDPVMVKCYPHPNVLRWVVLLYL